MDSRRIGRLVLLRERLRDGARARANEAREAFAQAEQVLASARARTSEALDDVQKLDLVTPAELELRARSVVEAEANERAADVRKQARSEELERASAERMEAERGVKLLEQARTRTAARERTALERHQQSESDDRSAARRRSA